MPTPNGEPKSTPTEPKLLASPSSNQQPAGPGLSADQPTTHSGNFFAFRPSENVRRFAKRYRTEISASTASVISTFTAFPLDFAKSRMQSYETGFLATVKDAYKMEGVRAFWRGVGPPLISVTVVRTISFSLYQKTKYALDRSIQEMTGQSPLAIANAPGTYPTLATISCFGCAGATAGGVITLLSCPFELTKLNQQLAGKMMREDSGARLSVQTQTGTNALSDLHKNRGSWATARRLARERGLAGLYSGYRLHLLRDTLGTGLYFTTYECAKQILGNARGASDTSASAVVVAGGLCGIVSWACVSDTWLPILNLIIKLRRADNPLSDISHRCRQDRIPKIFTQRGPRRACRPSAHSVL